MVYRFTEEYSFFSQYLRHGGLDNRAVEYEVRSSGIKQSELDDLCSLSGLSKFYPTQQ